MPMVRGRKPLGGGRRSRASKQRMRSFERAMDLVIKYDRNKDGILSKAQLRSIMAEVKGGPEREIAETDVETIARRLNQPKRIAKVDMAGSCGRFTDVCDAISIWHATLEDRAYIRKVFEQFDTNGDFVLDKDELKKLLFVLSEESNEGPPTDEEVMQVMKKVSREGVRKEDLRFALKEWFSCVEQRKTESLVCTLL